MLVLRRRRPRPRRRGRALGRVLELRPGLLRRRADLRRAAAVRAVRRGADPAGAALRLGRGDDPASELGPLIAEEQREHVEELVADAVGRGAEVRTGGRRADIGLPGLVLRADGARPAWTRGRIEREEIFGPGRHRRAVPRRRGGGAARQRLGVRARRERLDARPRPRAAAGAAARGRLGVDERRRVLVRHRPGVVGRRQGVGLRAHALEARALRLHAGEVRRSRPRARAGAVVVPVRPGRLDGFAGVVDVLYGDGLARKAGRRWRHRRGLVHLGRRYLSGS